MNLTSHSGYLLEILIEIDELWSRIKLNVNFS